MPWGTESGNGERRCGWGGAGFGDADEVVRTGAEVRTGWCRLGGADGNREWGGDVAWPVRMHRVQDFRPCKPETETMTETAAAPAAPDAPDAPDAPEQRCSLRERKKLATRRLLRRTALDLVA